jgi:hypothetical protein
LACSITKADPSTIISAPAVITSRTPVLARNVKQRIEREPPDHRQRRNRAQRNAQFAEPHAAIAARCQDRRKRQQRHDGQVLEEQNAEASPCRAAFRARGAHQEWPARWR